MVTAVHLINRSLNSTLDVGVPEEAWFGYESYVHVPREKRSKLEPKSRNIAIDGIKNYTYYGMSYDLEKQSDSSSNYLRKNMTAAVYQESKEISVLTAQLHQNFHLGPLNWENVVTWQNSSKQDVLPLPTWNLFSNIYLKFKIAHVLDVELGADATYFSKYYAPDFCPALNQFAVQHPPMHENRSKEPLTFSRKPSPPSPGKHGVAMSLAAV